MSVKPILLTILAMILSCAAYAESTVPANDTTAKATVPAPQPAAVPAPQAAPVQQQTTAPAKQAAAPEQKAEAPAKQEPKRGDKYLHISTNPHTADIYVNRKNADYASIPDYKSPDFIPVANTDSIVRISLFQKEYADTTLDVKLSEKDTSFVIIALRQSYDEKLINEQNKMLAHRSRRAFGHKMLFASIFPLMASAASALITQYYINEANNDKDYIEKSFIQSDKSYRNKKESFDDNKSKARTAKAVGGTTLGIGLTLLTVGVVLSF